MNQKHKGGFWKGAFLFGLGIGAGFLAAKFLKPYEAECRCEDEDCCCSCEPEEEYRHIQVEPLSDEEA